MTIPGVRQEREQGLLRVQAVLGLIEDDRRGGVHDVVGDLVAAVCWEAMHEQSAAPCPVHQRPVDLIRRKDAQARLGLLFLAHRRPHVRVHRIGVTHRRDRTPDTPRCAAFARLRWTRLSALRGGGSYPSGAAMMYCAYRASRPRVPPTSATLLPSPTNASVRPDSVPNRSRSVSMSASA